MNLKVLAATSMAAVSLCAVPTDAASQAQISYQVVNVRSNPSTKAYVNYKATKGSRVSILSYKNGWYQVSINGRRGWVTASAVSFKKINNNNYSNNKYNNTKTNKNTYVSPRNYGAYVNIGSLNYRTGPSTSNTALGRLPYKQYVRVIGQSGGWSKIQVNGRVGYVATSYLSASAPKGNLNNNAVVKKNTNVGYNSYNMRVNAPVLNIRSSTSTSSRRIGTLRQNQNVQVIGKSGSWTKVRVNGIVGYVASSYLTNGVSSTNSNNSYINNNSYQAIGTTKYVKQGTSLNNFVNRQSQKLNTINTGYGWRSASKAEIRAYADPNSPQNRNSSYQYAKLNRYTPDMNAYQVNRYLNSYCGPNSVFYNKGQSFINAARSNNINVLYFVSHSMVETGYGKSRLAKGSYYNGQKVYNFYGIGAYDGNAYMGGKQTAYRNGWTSVDRGLNGSANWISRNYIHNPVYRQDTLYKMRWDNQHPNHQYASDIRWPKVIGSGMQSMTRYSNKAPRLSYEKPVYR